MKKPRENFTKFKKTAKFSKKGQGGIISTVLIILIAIVLIIILVNIIYSFIYSNKNKIKTSHIGVSFEILEVITFFSGETKITIKRNNLPGLIDELRFVFYDKNGNSKSITKNENIPKELETKTFYFSSILELTNLEKVSLYPVIGKNIGTISETKFSKIYTLPPGLVSFFDFNDNLADSLNNNHGSLTGDAILKSDSLFFENNGKFIINDSEKIDFPITFALSIFVYPNSYSKTILYKGLSFQNYNLSIDSLGRIVFVCDGNDNRMSIESSKIIELNNWSHVFININSAGISKIFINGNEEFFTGINSPIKLNNDSLVVGDSFLGKIDNLMIFNTTVISDSVQIIYNHQKQ
jgi:hypothetical protein